jgi:hypothetical protein
VCTTAAQKISDERSTRMIPKMIKDPSTRKQESGRREAEMKWKKAARRTVEESVGRTDSRREAANVGADHSRYCQLESRKETNARPHKRPGRSRRGGARKEGGAKRKTPTNRRVLKQITIAYSNIQGKLGRNSNENWKEFERMIRRHKWDIIILTETHWVKGIEAKPIRGYKKYSKERKPLMKKGGGLAIFVKNGIAAYEWHDDNEHDDEQTNAESLFVVVDIANASMAVGTAYLASQEPMQREWNDEIQEKIARTIQTAQLKGHRVFIAGDFNGHVATEDGGTDENVKRSDWNGQRVVQIAREGNLRIINSTDKCEGKWTWMKRNLKSVIDYVITDETTEGNIEKMV